MMRASPRPLGRPSSGNTPCLESIHEELSELDFTHLKNARICPSEQVYATNRILLAVKTLVSPWNMLLEENARYLR